MALIQSNKNLLPSFSRFWDDDNYFSRDMTNWGNSNYSNSGTLPAVNIKETKDSFEVELAAPGMKKDDFKIELDGTYLTITSEKTEEHEENGKENYSRREFSYQSFQRSFNLPKEVVDADKIEAYYKDGVLHLTIPKKEEVKQKPPRKIKIM